MRNIFVWFALLILPEIIILGQTKRHFEVDDPQSCKRIEFTLNASSGTCAIRTRNGKMPISIMGNYDEKFVTTDFGQKYQKDVLHAWLNLKDNGKENFRTKLGKIFGTKSVDHDNYWNIYFSDHSPYRLDLTYGVGKAYVDLSDIAVENCRIKSGNAFVEVGYLSKEPNKIDMDSLIINVDMGDIEIKRLNLARAKNVMAKVGFGSLLLDFEEIPENSCDIWASVGAGSLVVYLPENEMPVLIHMKQTNYRKFNMPLGFREIADNTFVNQSYAEDAKNLQTFNIDLSMGSVEFRNE